MCWVTLSLTNMLLNTGLGGVVFGHVIVLQPPGNFNTPVNNCGGSFTLTWSAVANATSYILQRKTLGGIWETIYNGPNLSFAQNNLAVGSYQYQIIAVKGTKQSAPVQTATVTVLQQGNVGSPYRSGNLLLQDVRSGCTTSPTQIGKYGCTDPSSANYDPTATISENCAWDEVPCSESTAPLYVGFDWTADKIYTVTKVLSCPNDGGFGLLTNLTKSGVAGSDNLSHWIQVVDATYTGTTATIRFTSTGPGYWATFSWTSIRRTE